MFFDMFFFKHWEGLAELIRKFAPFRVLITLSQTQLACGSRQNSVHAGLPPKIHSPSHASTTSKNVYLRRPHRFHASDPLPIFLAISLNMHRHQQPFRHRWRHPFNSDTIVELMGKNRRCRPGRRAVRGMRRHTPCV